MAGDKMMTPEGTVTHPFAATILMDPSQLYSFGRAFEDRPEVRILKVDDQTLHRALRFASPGRRPAADA
jgi:hypothetical protein